MFKWLRSMKIKTKILAVAFIAIFLSICIISTSNYIYVHSIFREQIVTDNRTIVSKVTQQVSYSMEDIERYAQGIALNDQVQLFLRSIKITTGFDYFDNEFKLDRALKEFTFLRANIIEDMFVVNSYNKSLDFNQMYTSTLNEDWYDYFRSDQGANGFSKPFFVATHLNSPKTKVISYVIDIYDEDNHRNHLGKLVILLNYNVLVQPMAIDLSKGLEIITLDKQGHIIYSPHEYPASDSLPKPEDMLLLEGVAPSESDYYIVEEIQASSWKIIGILSKEHINTSLKYINFVLLLILFLSLLIMMMIIYPVMNNLTKPLIKLIWGMRRVSKGDLETQIQVNSGDEIEEVSHIFNNMVKDIKNLLEESVLMEKKKRNLSIKMFMYQINPHFIYNTLNSVIYLARKADSPEIVELIKAFVSFLQRTIKSQPEVFSSIENEMRYIDDYLLLLKYRYHDRVDISWQIDEDAQGYRIPQMILYPLVENSIFHGILPATEKGRIRIIVTKKKTGLKLCVEDNGVGIPPQRVEELRQQMASNSLIEEEVSDHIGLQNVNNRLKLLFGESNCLNIESVENEGTRVWFLLPYRH
jgi:two-component system sensor histidine kinase YesM